MRVLVADDELEMAVVLQALLEREHFSVDTVYSGPDALAYGLAENYDCLVLDIMMPGLDGIQVLEALRRKNISTPVLLLTAKSQVEDRIAGLNSGADDYLPKPFHNGEFIARVRALTRRGREFSPSILSAGNVELDCTTFELRCGDVYKRQPHLLHSKLQPRDSPQRSQHRTSPRPLSAGSSRSCPPARRNESPQ